MGLIIKNFQAWRKTTGKKCGSLEVWSRTFSRERIKANSRKVNFSRKGFLKNPNLKEQTIRVTMEEERAKPVCAQEALDLLNCVAQSPYDQEKCVLLLQALRECVLNKVSISPVFNCFRSLFLFRFLYYRFWNPAVFVHWGLL